MLRDAVLVRQSSRSFHSPQAWVGRERVFVCVCVSKLGKDQTVQSVPGKVTLGSLNVRESLLVAATAGSINVILTNPVWVLATRMQAGRQRQSVREALKEAYRENGYKWIFKVEHFP